MRAARFSFLAPAKLNISLRVFGRRPDGFHEIRSVMVPVSLCDEVTVSNGEEEGIHVSVEGNPAVPTDARNSCAREARLFMDWAGGPKGVRIDVTKRIPVEAGLGGGSSDAAATLKGLMALTGLAPPEGTLTAMASAVGADVPFFLEGGPALVEGFGDRLRPIEWEVPFVALIVKPPFGLPTGEGYRRLAREPAPPPPPAAAPRLRSWDDVRSAVANDFEAAWGRDRPEIGEIKEALLAAGARAAGLSGSGSAVFGLFEGEEEARRAQGALASRGGDPSPGGERAMYVAHNL